MSVRLRIPEAYEFLWTPSRYKAIYGGRGSAKSHSVAGKYVIEGFESTQRFLCCRERQNSIGDSVKQLLDDKIGEAGLTDFYTSTKTEIVGRNGTRFLFSGLHDQTADSLKSKEGVTRCWVEEAHSVSQRSLDILMPTIRTPGSEITFTWNPDTEFDPVDMMFRGKHVPPNAIVRRVSWRDNPWFPEVLRQQMEFDQKTDPQKAAHVWDGEYQAAPKGAYFAELLATARLERRIGHIPAEPLLETHVGFDLGNGPNMCLVFTQWIGKEVRIVETLAGNDEAASEGWPWYIRELKRRKYVYGKIILPHDARIRQRSTGKGDEAALIEAGFNTTVVPRMDPGERVKLIQRFLPSCWIDENKCADGLRSWKSYCEDYDEKLRISRGPLHNWASHYSDALGHVAQAYEMPRKEEPTPYRPRYQGKASWMA